MLNLVILKSVIFTYPFFAVLRRYGIIEPREPKTLPYLTIENL